MADTSLRRLRTIATMAGALVLMVLLAPVTVPVVAMVDAVRWLVRGRHAIGIRLYLFGLAYLAAEMVGLGALGVVWLTTWGGRRQGTLLDATFAIQCRWAGALLGAASRIFGLRIELTGQGVVAPGPILLLARHASIVDNLLPPVLVSKAFGIRLRYVLKKELLADPCLDVAGNRLPNYFVDRSSADTQRELDAIRELGSGLGVTDGVLIYPEGTRFTPAKQQRALQHLASSDPALLERARRLRHVLPPRLGGPLTLLEATAPADVVVLTHHGLDGFAQLRDIWAGGLVGATVRVEFWRIPHQEVPAERVDRVNWLYDIWTRVDNWIDDAARAAEAQ